MATKTTEAREATLRAATREDLPAIEKLLVSSGLPTAGVAEGLGGFIVAESEDDRRIVGVAGLECCSGEYALLRSTAVEPSWRGTGLGRRLVTHLIADAESRGIKALYLLTTTAERYFPSFGFVRTQRDVVPDEIKESVEFREACPASATVMALELG
jgi:N-acetylglutamate synthase-like GNAT family acetyltransferase